MGLRVSDLGFRISDLGFRVYETKEYQGFRTLGLGLRGMQKALHPTLPLLETEADF